jgi:hypothetical protein
MLTVEMRSDEVPEIFVRFGEAVGAEHWVQRVEVIEADIRGNPFLREHLMAENAIAFALFHCNELLARHGRFPPSAMHNPAVFAALSLVAQLMSIIKVSSPNQAHRLIRRIHGAFKKPDDMRAIQLELAAATHFVLRGHSICWPEMENLGTFDLLINGIGNNGLEIECKSISDDKGRKVHKREALEFHQLISQRFTDLGRCLHSGLSVVLTVPKRLPSSIAEKRELADRIISSVMSAKSNTFEDGVDITIKDFDSKLLDDLDSDGNPIITNPLIDKITATQNCHAMIVGRKLGGAMILVLRSADGDTYLGNIFNTISDSAKRQITKTRPAIFMAGLSLAQDQLVEVAQQDMDPQQQPTALRVAASDFLSSRDRDYVVGVGFLSQTSVGEAASGLAAGGSAYYFPKREGPFWHQDFSGLFAPLTAGQ